MEPIAIGLIDHSHPVMGGMALEREQAPAGRFLWSSAGPQQQGYPPKQSQARHPSPPEVAILKQIRCICLRLMALTPSTMLALGTGLPDFELPQVTGGRLSSSSLDQRPVLLMVLCAHCPFVKHVEPEITRLDHDFSNAVQLVGVSSNSLITHPQDGPEQLAEQAKRHGWSFPYLLDEQQTLARALRAACTPEFYLFSPDGEGLQSLRYRGQLDDSRPGNDQPLDGRDLRAALEAVLTGALVNPDQTASVGCNVKWNPGQEPEWFG